MKFVSRKFCTQADRVDKKVKTFCYQCVAGPDLLTVNVRNGVAVGIEPDLSAASVHPGGGKVCVKAFGIVQKAYHPNRVLTPMKRTNPNKGRHEDPGFVPITWDEAMDIIADKLNGVRATGLLEVIGEANFYINADRALESISATVAAEGIEGAFCLLPRK